MKQISRIPGLLAVLSAVFIASAGLRPVFAGDVPPEVITLGLKFLDDPGDFFFNLHSSNEDYSPLPSDKNGSVRFNFFPTFFPVTWANLSARANVKRGQGYWPQIDLAGSYGDLLALHAISSGDSENSVKPSFNDYSVGIVASKEVEKDTRLFCGLKYSSVQMEVVFSSPIAAGDFRISELKFSMADTFFYSGISHHVGNYRYIVGQLGYGFKYKKIVSRVMVSNKHFEYGMDIFPEGLFVFHPFFGWHWYF
jgi:hypothetical protein